MKNDSNLEKVIIVITIFNEGFTTKVNERNAYNCDWALIFTWIPLIPFPFSFSFPFCISKVFSAISGISAQPWRARWILLGGS